MFVFPEKHFNKVYWGFSSLILCIVVLRCIFVPFSHDEVATFNFYIQPGNFWPFLSHPDANGHFLMSATSWLFFELVGSSPQSLRIPSILSFLVLCYGVFRMNKLFPSLTAKLVFSSAFLLSFNFISFYSLCRGYGMSMAFLILAMYYFFVFKSYGAKSHFLKFLLFSQLALSANLTLLFVVAICTCLLLLAQLKNILLRNWKIYLALFLHFSLLVFWIKYAFFLKEHGALYYGSGNNYWQVTFKTLIDTVIGEYTWAYYFFIAGFLSMLVFYIFYVAKNKMNEIIHGRFSISLVILLVLIVSFYLLKLILHVNYPEDRTGLFFYIFYVIAFCFMLCEINQKFRWMFNLIPLYFVCTFFMLFNLRVHPWKVYETMPYSFFDLLIEEQHKADHRITIGGHRVREFFYSFLNYKSYEKLNHMTAPEALQMNCDYALAYKQDKPYYEKYYDEIAEDNDWDFRLLKRKVPMERKPIFNYLTYPLFSGSNEYYNTFEKTDTTFHTDHPMVAEFNFSVKKAHKPFNVWLVLQIDDADNAANNQFMRIPLNLVKFNWNNTNYFTLSIVSGNMPKHIKRIVAYFWNIDKTELEIQMNRFTLFQLNGEGIKEISKAKI